MHKTAFCLPFLLLAASAAHAQATPGCPQLPAGTDLIWEHRNTNDSDFCRALRIDGTEAFGVYIANDSPFEPKRGNREEAGVVDGREVQWYRAELVTKPDIEARETLVELDDGRVAHIWLQAPSGEQLDKALDLTRQLRFSPDRQVAAGQ
ncbi:MAG: hypothetical protein ACREPV_12845 [Lysobacter sp.]